MRSSIVALLLAGSVALSVPADAAGGQNPAAAPAQSGQPGGRVTLPPVTVTAQKEPADPSKLPVSVTTVTGDVLSTSGITFAADAAFFSPNTNFTEFTARKLSNARIRGVGASPANPGVTTYIDGVPQFNANTSSIDLIDVAQIEFVRGPQSALFGRNALGGIINISSGRPSLSKWTGSVAVPFGNFGQVDLRAGASGPLAGDTLAAGFAMAYSERDGFTRNDLTGNDLDRRSGFSGKGQLLWTPNAQWETRVIVSGERARDGDYALNDLFAVRDNPFHVSRDFEGHTDRDVFSTAALVRRETSRLSISSTTGLVRWRTEDSTDLDYTPLPLATRLNVEKAIQFTQEVRVASAANAPLAVSDGITMRWQAGSALFTQNYDQDAANSLAPFTVSEFVNFPVLQRSPQATLDDFGVSLYGQGTLTISDRLDLSFGARLDHERKQAELRTSFEPAIAPPTIVDVERNFTDVSPQVAAAFRLQDRTMLYASAARAFKAGGFNPQSLPGSEAYGEEHAWHFEAGVKTSVAEGRVSLSATVFSIDWDDLQLNLPIPFAPPGSFFISNIGGATSRGVEFELAARPHANVDLFASIGTASAHFAEGTTSGGLDVSDKIVPNTPEATAAFGVQLSRTLRASTRLYARADVAYTGSFQYDDANTQGEDGYTLTHLRAGLRGRLLFVEAWVRNAFDTRYVPLAFAYPGFSASGFVAEAGRPRTFGISVGVGF